MKSTAKWIACLLAFAVLLPLCPVSHAASVLRDGDYERVARVPYSSGCGTMQGMAVGDTYAYTANINGSDTLAQVMQTHLETGKVRTMINGETGENTFEYLSHANDMDVAKVNGTDWLFVAAGDRVIVFEVDDESGVLWERAEYTPRHKGSAFAPVGISIYEINEREITFLFKGGYAISRGSVSINDRVGNVDVEILCSLDVNQVPVNGRATDLSHFLNQGFEYRDGKVYAVFAGCSRKESINHSMILAFDITTGAKTVYPEEDTVLYMVSESYRSLFEVQSCGFTPDGELYFNVNGSSNAIFRMKDFRAEPLPAEEKNITYTVRFDGNGAAGGVMGDMTVAWGDLVSVPKHPYDTSDRRLAGWRVSRSSDNKIFCVHKKDLSDAVWLDESEIGGNYKAYVLPDGGFVKSMSEVDGDTVVLTAQWELYGDINRDGILSIGDVIAFRLFCDSAYPMPLTIRNLMDVTGDVAVNLSDVWCLFAYLAGAIDKLPVCE